MKLIAAYLLAVLGGNASPSSADLKDILGSGAFSHLSMMVSSLHFLPCLFDQALTCAWIYIFLLCCEDLLHLNSPFFFFPPVIAFSHSFYVFMISSKMCSFLLMCSGFEQYT